MAAGEAARGSIVPPSLLPTEADEEAAERAQSHGLAPAPALDAEAAPAPEPRPGPEALSEALRALKRQRDAGDVTEPDFESKKARLLALMLGADADTDGLAELLPN